MAKVVTDQGLERTKDQLLHTSGWAAERYPRAISIDDSTTALAAATTTLGSPANLFDADAAASEVSNGRGRLTVTVPAGSGNFTIRRMVVHDDTAANVSGASATVYAGFSGHALQKDANTVLTLSIDLAYV